MSNVKNSFVDAFTKAFVKSFLEEEPSVSSYIGRFIRKVVKITFIVIFLIGASLLSGIVVRDMWKWFITPLGVSCISIVQGMGINVLVTLWTFKIDTKKLEESITFRTICCCVVLLFSWGIGYILFLFM